MPEPTASELPLTEEGIRNLTRVGCNTRTYETALGMVTNTNPSGQMHTDPRLLEIMPNLLVRDAQGNRQFAPNLDVDKNGIVTHTELAYAIMAASELVKNNPNLRLQDISPQAIGEMACTVERRVRGSTRCEIS